MHYRAYLTGDGMYFLCLLSNNIDISQVFLTKHIAQSKEESNSMVQYVRERRTRLELLRKFLPGLAG